MNFIYAMIVFTFLAILNASEPSLQNENTYNSGFSHVFVNLIQFCVLKSDHH